MALMWHIVEASPSVEWSYEALTRLSTTISVEAFGEDRKLPTCSGRHPHLSPTPEAPCGE